MSCAKIEGVDQKLERLYGVARWILSPTYGDVFPAGKKTLCICLTHLVVRLELELPELTATAEGSPAPEASSLQERRKEREC